MEEIEKEDSKEEVGRLPLLFAREAMEGETNDTKELEKPRKRRLQKLEFSMEEDQNKENEEKEANEAKENKKKKKFRVHRKETKSRLKKREKKETNEGEAFTDEEPQENNDNRGAREEIEGKEKRNDEGDQDDLQKNKLEIRKKKTGEKKQRKENDEESVLSLEKSRNSDDVSLDEEISGLCGSEDSESAEAIEEADEESEDLPKKVSKKIRKAKEEAPKKIKGKREPKAKKPEKPKIDFGELIARKPNLYSTVDEAEEEEFSGFVCTNRGKRLTGTTSKEEKQKKTIFTEAGDMLLPKIEFSNKLFQGESADIKLDDDQHFQELQVGTKLICERKAKETQSLFEKVSVKLQSVKSIMSRLLEATPEMEIESQATKEPNETQNRMEEEKEPIKQEELPLQEEKETGVPFKGEETEEAFKEREDPNKRSVFREPVSSLLKRVSTTTTQIPLSPDQEIVDIEIEDRPVVKQGSDSNSLVAVLKANTAYLTKEKKAKEEHFHPLFRNVKVEDDGFFGFANKKKGNEQQRKELMAAILQRKSQGLTIEKLKSTFKKVDFDEMIPKKENNEALKDLQEDRSEEKSHSSDNNKELDEALLDSGADGALNAQIEKQFGKKKLELEDILALEGGFSDKEEEEEEEDENSEEVAEIIENAFNECEDATKTKEQSKFGVSSFHCVWILKKRKEKAEETGSGHPGIQRRNAQSSRTKKGS